jgi:hypothetical protein
MTLPIDPTWICKKKKKKKKKECSSGTLLASLPKMKSVEPESYSEKDGRLKKPHAYSAVRGTNAE